MNSYSLYNIGPFAQSSFGAERFVATYLASGLVANVATYATNSSPYSLGASGCTFGLIGALLIYFWRNKRILGPRADQTLSQLKQTIVLNLMFGFMAPGIDNGGHIGGLIGGGAFSYLFGPRLFVNESTRRIVDRPLVNYLGPYRAVKRALIPDVSSILGGGEGEGGGGGGGGGGRGDRRNPSLRPKGRPLEE